MAVPLAPRPFAALRLVALAGWLAAACYAAPDLDGSFRCAGDPVCPAGRACVQGVCLAADDAAHGFVWLDAASFVRGCEPGPDCPVDAQPARTISVSGFLLQDHEVTEAEYDACVTAVRCRPPLDPPASGPDLPVRGLAIEDAERYCQFLGGRLPTEAEWERAARERGGPYPWGTAAPTCALANSVGCQGAVTRQTTSGDTPSGLHDLAGNVREWVQDRYAPDYYGRSADTDPLGPDRGEDAVVRGGSFVSPTTALRVWARDQVARTAAPDDVGVRCAKAR